MTARAPDQTAGTTAATSDGATLDPRLQVSIGCNGAVVLAGEIDVATAPLLDAALRAVADVPRVQVDLRRVTYLDSAAVTVLFAHAHRPMHLVAQADSTIADVLRICALSLVARVELLPPAG